MEDLKYITTTKAAGKLWGKSEHTIKLLARNNLVIAKKIGTAWGIDTSFPPYSTNLDTEKSVLQFLVDTKAAAAEWNLSEHTVKKLANSQKIIAVKLGSSWAIDIRQPNPSKYKKAQS